MIPIFITSWERIRFTRLVIQEINKRTEPGTYSIHVLDNGSCQSTVAELCALRLNGDIHGLTLLPHNTRCVHPKHVFSALTPDSAPFAVITDNDFIPSVGWLPGLVAILERNPSLAMVSPQYWPQWPMEPGEVKEDYVSCRAIGNTFRLIRTHAMHFAISQLKNEYGLFGDDGDLCRVLKDARYDVGFARNTFCFNLELTEDNWGYTEEELKLDPRKSGYPSPGRYMPLDWGALEPPAHLKIG